MGFPLKEVPEAAVLQDRAGPLQGSYHAFPSLQTPAAIFPPESIAFYCPPSSVPAILPHITTVKERDMKKLGGLLTVMAVLVAAQGVAGQADMKKYDIKSGIVTLDSVMKVGALEIKFQYVVYFDDYGMKECKETYKDGQLVDVVFSDGKTLYALKPGKKTAVKKGDASRGTEMRVDYPEMGSQKDRDSGKVRKIDPLLVAGKQCEAVETNDGSGIVTQYAGWKKIMVYMKSSSANTTATINAVKIEEDVAVPAAKFQVPDGYTLK
jgi:hypothetical protein